MCIRDSPTIDHATSIANAAVRFLRYLARRNTNADTAWHCRIGLGPGTVIGSVVGVQKYVYDIFGEAVRLAGEARDLAASGEALADPSLLELLPAGNLELTQARVDSARELGLQAVAGTD